MRTIHKVARPLDGLYDWTEIELPSDASVLSVGNQHGALCWWYETTTDAPPHRKKVRRWFRVCGTGHPVVIPGDAPAAVGRFLGTVQFLDGKLVFHVYEGMHQ